MMDVKSDVREECDEPERLILFKSEMEEAMKDLISVINPEEMIHAYKDISLFKKNKNLPFKLCNNLSETLHANLITMIADFSEFYELKKSLNNLVITEQEDNINFILKPYNRNPQEIVEGIYTQNRMQFKRKLEEIVQKKEIAVDCMMKDVEKLRESNNLNLEKIRLYRSKINSIYNGFNAT